MNSEDVIPEEEKTDGATPAANDLTVSLRNQYSMIEKGNTPLIRPSPQPSKRNNFRKATSLYVDTPSKFIGGANTTIGAGSGISRQSKVSQPQIEDFINHTQSVSQVLQSKNIRELMSNIVISMKRIFKVQKVNFLLQCKETIDLLRKEGAQVVQMQHAHQTFWVLIPDTVKREKDFEMNFCFKNIADVMKGKAFSGRSCVAPVFKLQKPDQSIMLIQLEMKAGSPFTFDVNRDKRAFDIISKIVSSIFERI